MRSHIFPKIAKNLGLQTWNKDYYGLETMFYEERGTDEFGRFTTYAKWITVALEHAIKPTKSHVEISKLQMFNASLKVLITYAAEGADSESLLRKYEAVMRDSDVFGDCATLRQQLVIFGTPRTVMDWQFYAYENDGFVMMLPNRVSATG
jgi:hypothetical protein